MDKFKDIENLNPRKLKSKEMIKMAEDCLGGNRQIELAPIDFYRDGYICQKLFDDSKTIYLNPTERLIMGDIVKEGDSFATVLGSGDFLLDGVYHGAREVVAFDINKHQLPAASLKVKGLQKLDFDSFWSFFSDVRSDQYLSQEVYNRIKEGDKTNVLFSFWDVLMSIRGEERTRISKDPMYQQFKNFSKLIDEDPELFMSQVAAALFSGMSVEGIVNFNEFYFDQAMIATNPSYKPSRIFKLLKGLGGEKFPGSYIESESSYLETRERLDASKLLYLKSDLCELKPKLLGTNKFRGTKFDGFNSIYLSNVPEYIDGNTFVNVVTEQLMPLLKDDGCIVYCCQGVDPQVLKTTSLDEITDMKVRSLRKGGEDFIWAFQEINDIEGYQNLANLYDVSTTTTDVFGACNGKADTDVFVKVKRKG